MIASACVRGPVHQPYLRLGDSQETQWGCGKQPYHQVTITAPASALGNLEAKAVKVAHMSTTPDVDPEDLTRKERREQARTERRAMEAAHQAQARRRRLMQLGGAVGAVVVIIVVILIASGGGGSKTATVPTGTQANQDVSAVTALLHGIPQSGNTLGSPNAPVTLQYFGDLECPICRDFTLGALPAVIAKYVRAGKLRIEYHSLETATREPATFHNQQVAALAAGKQNLGWYYIELFYHEQGQEGSGYVTESYLQNLAQQVPGLNLANWSVARNEAKLAEAVTTDAQTANLEGFTGTPSFLIGKTGGAPSKLENPSLTEPSGFEAAINKLLV
jgi:protein-disulfide isomerase